MKMRFNCRWTAKELSRDPELRKNIKEFTGKPDLNLDLDPRDEFNFNYELDFEDGTTNLLDRLSQLHDWVPEQFDDLPTQAMAEEVERMRDACDALSELIETLLEEE